MKNLIDLYIWLHKEKVSLFVRHLPFSDSNTKSATICLHAKNKGVFIDGSRLQTRAEEKSALAHECGHCATGTTHQVSSPLDLVGRHEYKADKWAAHYLIPPEELLQALEDGCTEPWELAERFGVAEDFIRRTEYIYQCEGIIPA